MDENIQSIKIKEEYKYICEKCNFKCNIMSRWNKHIITELHITGKKKRRSDYKGDDKKMEKKIIEKDKKCEKCDYLTNNKYQLQQHYLNYHATKEERETDFKYYCKCCDYGTYSKDFIEKHNNTNKHKIQSNL